MPLSRDLRQFVECLNSNRVDFLVVGALAVSWHGFPRSSADIDFFIRSSTENGQRVLDAIREFGFGSLPLSLADFTTPNRVVQLGHEPNRIDIMTSISGVSFEEAWQTKVTGTVDGVCNSSAWRHCYGIRRQPGVPRTASILRLCASLDLSGLFTRP